jgi:hypothetical protein
MATRQGSVDAHKNALGSPNKAARYLKSFEKPAGKKSRPQVIVKDAAHRVSREQTRGKIDDAKWYNETRWVEEMVAKEKVSDKQAGQLWDKLEKQKRWNKNTRRWEWQGPFHTATKQRASDMTSAGTSVTTEADPAAVLKDGIFEAATDFGDLEKMPAFSGYASSAMAALGVSGWAPEEPATKKARTGQQSDKPVDLQLALRKTTKECEKAIKDFKEKTRKELTLAILGIFEAIRFFRSPLEVCGVSRCSPPPG